MSNNILICLEQLGIGGVETAVLNRAKTFAEKGNNVFVLAKDGIYKEIFEKKGVHVIDFSFDIVGNIDLEKVEKICNIINENNIDQVHIHQYPCLPSACFACCITKIPYIIYVHTQLIEPYEWYMKNFPIQKEYMELFFKNAFKVISITKKASNNVMEYFKIKESEKFIVEQNSIDFSEFKPNRSVKKIKNFLIIARLEEEKFKSIINAIDVFYEYIKIINEQDIRLTIVGDGKIKEKIMEYVKNKEISDLVTFVGKVNNVKDYIENSDIVIAMGRCILEAIAMKRVAVISGVSNLKGIVNKYNIDSAVGGNFTGRSIEKEDGTEISEMPNKTAKEIAEQIIELKEGEIHETVEYNYDVIFSKLNIEKNCFFINREVNVNYKEIIFKLLYENNEKIELENRIPIEDYNKLKSDYNNLIMEYEEENKMIIRQNEDIMQSKNIIEKQEQTINQQYIDIDNLKNDISKYKEELDCIVNSKRWKFSSKIAGVVNKIRKKC